MAVRQHGGGCCGMRHSSGYSLNNDTYRIYEKIREDKRCRDRGRLIEVVVTDSQLRSQSSLGPILAAEGFRLVSRFTNDNTGNICNVFHFIEKRNIQSIYVKDIPYSINAADAPEAPPPVNWRPLRENERPSVGDQVRVNNRKHWFNLSQWRYAGTGRSKYCYYGSSRVDWADIQILKA